MIWIIWMSRQVAKRTVQHSNFFCKWSELCGWSSQLQRAFSVLQPFFLAHRTKLVGCVRTAEEGWNIDISKNIWWHSAAGLCEWSRQETHTTHNLSCKVTKSCCKYFQSMDGTHLWGFQLQGLGDWSVTEARDRSIYLPLFQGTHSATTDAMGWLLYETNT